jgi:hypothetical protein
VKRALALVCSLWLCACVSLDKAPRKLPDSSGANSHAGQGGEPDAQADAAASGDGGDPADGSAGQAAQGGSAAGGASGSGGMGGSGENGGSAAGASCGDGVLDDGEQCDMAIASGAGSCPSACTTDDACAPRSLSGSGCDAHCETRAISDAIDGDGCCPAGADVASDRDCCRMPEERAVIAGENERVDSASELGDPTTQAVIADGGSLVADYLGESLGCGASDENADAVYSFVPSADYPLVLGIDGGGVGAVYALFDEPPPAAVFLHAPRPTSCQGLRLNGRVYFSCPAATWTQAREHCASAGLALARIGDMAENDALRAALGSGTHWIGLNDRDTEGSFVWTDASAPSFTSWAASDPDGGAAQDCVELSADGSWNDRSCDDSVPFVCELSGKLTDDTLPDATTIELDDRLYMLDGDAVVYGVDRDPGLDVCGADAGFPDGFIPLDLAQDATVEIDTTGSSFAPVIALYTRNGSVLTGDAPLGCHDAAVDGAAETVDLVAGSYLLVVSGKGSPSAFRIAIRDVARATPGHWLACGGADNVTTFEPVAGKRYYAIVKSHDTYRFGVGPDACW